MSSEREHLLKLRAQHKKNIKIVEGQIANYGMAPPLYLVNQLDHEQTKLAEVEDRLAVLTNNSGTEAAGSATPGASATTGGVAVVGDGNVIVVGGMEGDITIHQPDADG